jgi:hypothetical protein
MTVSTTINRVSYTGNGATVSFSTVFPYILAADITVYVAGALKTLTTHYTLSGGGGSSGSVTFLSAPTTGQAVVILRDPAKTQDLDLVENDPLPAEELEKAFDKLTMLLQRQADLTSRAFILPDTVTTAVSTTLPSPEAGKLLGWSADALTVVNTSASAVGAGSIGTTELADDAVTADKLATDAVTASAIAALAVGTSELAAGAATLAKLDTTGAAGTVLTAAGAGLAPVWSSPTSVSVRQTVQAGASSSGQAACVSTGSGLQPGFLATSVPVSISFAGGFDAYGAVDYVSRVSSDATWPAVPASVVSFLSASHVSATSVSLTSTQAPPQYAYSYPQNAQSSLTLNNVATDAFGNTFTNSNVTFTNATPKYSGTYYGVFNGSSAKLASTSFRNLLLYPTGWTVRIAFRSTSISTAQGIVTIGDASGQGVELRLSSSKLVVTVFAAQSGTAVINGVSSTNTLSSNTWYDLEITQDPITNKLYVYIDGTADSAFTTSCSSSVYATSNIFVGATGATGTNYFVGNLQGFEIKPYCAHPGGTAFTPQTSLASITATGYSSDWFDLSSMTMNSISAASTVAGTSPTFNPVNSVYIGEAIAGASTISSVVSYAYNRRYSSAPFPVAATTAYAKSHNLGIPPELISFSVTANAGASVSQGAPQTQGYYGGAYGYIPTAGVQTRNSISMTTLTYPITNTTGSVTAGYYAYNVSGVF